MGHEPGREESSEERREDRSEERLKSTTQPNRREFLAGSVGAVAAGMSVKERKWGAFGAAAGGNAAPVGNALAEKGPTPDAPLRVILDSDPGVDDALAILLALRSP